MSLIDVFSEYLQDVKPSGDDHIRASCPCHRRKKRAFYAHAESGYWSCFSCGQSGSLRSFLEIVTSNAAEAFEKAKDLVVRVDAKTASLRRVKKTDADARILPDYILGAWDKCPTMLLRAGFDETLLREHDVGYDESRSRITFPIRDRTGHLVGVAGRTTVPDVEPRYLVYGSAKEFMHINDKYRPDTRRYLYGFQTIWPKRYYEKDLANFPPIILVEGYKGTLWMRQQGFRSTVGLMGSSLSPGQFADISSVRGPFYVFLDNEPGKQQLTWEPLPPERTIKTRFGQQYHDLSCSALRIARKLQRVSPTFIVRYPPGGPDRTSPDDLTKEQISWGIANAELPAAFFTRERDALRERGVRAPTERAPSGAQTTTPQVRADSPPPGEQHGCGTI